MMRYRGDLAGMYFVTLSPTEDEPAQVRLVPMQVRHFQLSRASATDARWIWQMLNREGAQFGTAVSLNADNSLTVRAAGTHSHATGLPKNHQNGE